MGLVGPPRRLLSWLNEWQCPPADLWLRHAQIVDGLASCSVDPEHLADNRYYVLA